LDGGGGVNHLKVVFNGMPKSVFFNGKEFSPPDDMLEQGEGKYKAVWENGMEYEIEASSTVNFGKLCRKFWDDQQKRAENEKEVEDNPISRELREVRLTVQRLLEKWEGK